MGLVPEDQLAKALVSSQIASPAGNTCFLSSITPEQLERAEQSNDAKVLGWDGPNDPANPRNFSKRRKWLIISAALLLTLMTSINGTSITVAAADINAEFGVSDVSFPNSYWTVTSWSLGGAVAVIIGIPLLEDLGVKLGCIIFYAIFCITVLLQAVAPNFATLVVVRFFSGGCVAILVNSVASVIPDLFPDDSSRSIPVPLWILAYLLGNTLGPPMFAEVIRQIGDWRWIFYIQSILYGTFFPVLLLMVKETRSEVILQRKARRLRKSGSPVVTPAEKIGATLVPRLRQALVRPTWLLLTESVVFSCTIWSAFCVGTVFMFTQSVQQVFEGVYGWDIYSTANVQSAVAIGEVVGWLASFYGTHLYFRSTKRNEEMPGRPIPEARLYVSIFGSFVGLTGGMFVYAWTAKPSIPWIAPAIGLAMVGFGVQVIVSGLNDYIADAYAASNYAASAVSCVAFGENMLAALLPLATKEMYSKLGYSWASGGLGFIALGISFAPVAIVWKGRQLRERSPFMLSGWRMFFEQEPKS